MPMEIIMSRSRLIVPLLMVVGLWCALGQAWAGEPPGELILRYAQGEADFPVDAFGNFNLPDKYSGLKELPEREDRKRRAGRTVACPGGLGKERPRIFQQIKVRMRPPAATGHLRVQAGGTS